jgi:fumarate reductase subunit C
MNGVARDTPAGPWRERMPIFWWLGKRAYVAFIVRELTSLAVGYTALLVLAELAALARGAEAHRRLVELLAHPLAVGVNSLVLVALLIHAVTWLNLAPKAMVVRLAGRRIPGGVVLAGHYLAWIAASAAVLGLLAGAGS